MMKTLESHYAMIFLIKIIYTKNIHFAGQVNFVINIPLTQNLFHD